MRDRYRAKNKEFKKREKELEEVTAKRDAVRKEFDDLRKKRLAEFMDGFNTITLKLKEMYQMITLGGDAELSWWTRSTRSRRASCSACVRRRSRGRT